MAERPGCKMKLGACYNLFDCEELLETSIMSIRTSCSYIVVVYQLVSNFGNPANPFLEDFLNDLLQRKLVDELVLYKPKLFNSNEKRALLSPRARADEVGGDAAGVGDQFFNELMKREIGRLKCLENGCTHFFSLDADEYYIKDELEMAKDAIISNDYDATFCWMRLFMKEAIFEYRPFDTVNRVPFIYKCATDKKFLLAEAVDHVVDPTRRVSNCPNQHLFPRSVVEMYHLTYVRKDIKTKLSNVSNRMNYGRDALAFLDQWEHWKPEDGPLHPHPYIGKFFTEIVVVPNYFGVDLTNQCRTCSKSHHLFRCSRCKQTKYCSERCQRHDWPQHKLVCQPLVLPSSQ